jgi:hypothetical protein
MAFDAFEPEVPRPSDYKAACVTLGYWWPPVRQELVALGLFALPSIPPDDVATRRSGDPVSIRNDRLSSSTREEENIQRFLTHWVGIVAVEDHASNVTDQAVCENGLALLLRHKSRLAIGIDAQVPCKVKGCLVCGPAKQARRVEHILDTFHGRPIHAVMLDDSEPASWEALHKTYIERGGANYHRIPSQDGKTVVLTDADIGEVISVEDVAMIVYVHPGDRGRRITSSRAWKMRSGSGNWERIGFSSMSADERYAVYEEVGCDPELAAWRGGFVTVQNVTLPEDLVRLNKLKERLGMPSEVILGENGWPL